MGGVFGNAGPWGEPALAIAFGRESMRYCPWGKPCRPRDRLPPAILRVSGRLRQRRFSCFRSLLRRSSPPACCLRVLPRWRRHSVRRAPTIATGLMAITVWTARSRIALRPISASAATAISRIATTTHTINLADVASGRGLRFRSGGTPRLFSSESTGESYEVFLANRSSCA